MTAGTDFGTPPPPSSSNYLGVPNGYVFVPPNPYNYQQGFIGPRITPQPVAPRYMTGDEFSIASMPPEQLARLQQSMATAGLIGSNTRVRVGLADDATVSAFKSLLSFANVNGLDWQGALSELAANPPSGGSVAVSNPLEEDTALRDAAQRLLGHQPNAQQLEGFRPYYEALTKQPTSLAATSSPTSSFDSTNPSTAPSATGNTFGSAPVIGSDATVTAPPSLDTAAEQYLRENDAAEIGTQRTMEMYRKLLDFIKGDGTITP